MKIRKLIAYTTVAMTFLVTFYPAYADTAPYTLPSDFNDVNLEEGEEVNNRDDTKQTIEFSVESAVAYGLENNPNIRILENKINIAMTSVDNAENNNDDLLDADDLLDKAISDVFDGKVLLREKQEELDAAESLLKNGRTPVPISYPLNELITIKISPTQDIKKKLEEQLTPYGLEGQVDTIYKALYSSIEKQLDANQNTINKKSVALTEAEGVLEYNKDKFKEVLEDSSEILDSKINYSSLIALEAEDLGKLMIKVAGVNLDVTKYAKGIYKNQIAMLIQKNYYDALHAQKILSLKEIAKERGEKQYDIVKLSYDNGMKSKDDMLLSKMYYDSTIIACRLAKAEYNNAIYELKKNINLDMSTEIILKEADIVEVVEESLENGLKSGLTNRIEIQQSLGELTIYELYENILKTDRKYKYEKIGKEEAKLLKEGAELKLEQATILVETEINQSYEMMTAAKEMLEASKELVINAQEVVDISKLKYEQGFGVGNSLLKQMNLVESSGTIIELVAAEENLSNIEAQVAKIRYSYIMAKVKYQNDCGIQNYCENEAKNQE